MLIMKGCLTGTGTVLLYQSYWHYRVKKLESVR